MVPKFARGDIVACWRNVMWRSRDDWADEVPFREDITLVCAYNRQESARILRTGRVLRDVRRDRMREHWGGRIAHRYVLSGPAAVATADFAVALLLLLLSRQPNASVGADV